MKRLTVVGLILLMLFSASCKKEPEEVYLSKNNLSSYLSISLSYQNERYVNGMYYCDNVYTVHATVPKTEFINCKIVLIHGTINLKPNGDGELRVSKTSSVSPTHLPAYRDNIIRTVSGTVAIEK